MKARDSSRPSTGTVEAPRNVFAGDPLRNVRREKRLIQVCVYTVIFVLQPIHHFVAHLNWFQVAWIFGLSMMIAVGAIEYAFLKFFKLRKQGVYPAMLAIEVGVTHDFRQACERSVRLVAELLGIEKVILVWRNHYDGSLTTVATHGIPPEDVPLATPLAWCQQSVRRAIEGREVVVVPSREGRVWSSGTDGRGRVVHVPLLSLRQLVGLLVLVGRRKRSDLWDKTLLTTMGMALGLTLDNLHHTVDLREVAMRDELTQLFNRRYFFEQFEKELSAARRSGRPVGLLILDVDKLKLINDTYGHNVGDQVLANLGKLLAKRVRAEDIPARIGGDEFAVLMRDTDKRRAFATVARLEKALQARPIYEGGEIELTLTVSCGVAVYPGSGGNATEIMQWADANMYEAKARRKGWVQAERERATQGRPLTSGPQ